MDALNHIRHAIMNPGTTINKVIEKVSNLINKETLNHFTKEKTSAKIGETMTVTPLTRGELETETSILYEKVKGTDLMKEHLVKALLTPIHEKLLEDSGMDNITSDILTDKFSRVPTDAQLEKFIKQTTKALELFDKKYESFQKETAEKNVINDMWSEGLGSLKSPIPTDNFKVEISPEEYITKKKQELEEDYDSRGTHKGADYDEAMGKLDQLLVHLKAEQKQ